MIVDWDLHKTVWVMTKINKTCYLYARYNNCDVDTIVFLLLGNLGFLNQ